MAVLLAIMATANVVWAITGKPVWLLIAAFAGFACGVAWVTVLITYAVQP